MTDRREPSTAPPASGEGATVYQPILAVIPSAAFIQDRQGRYLDCNKAFEIFVHLPREAIIGKGIADLYPPGLAEKCRQEDEQVIRSQEVGSFPAFFRRMSGSQIATEILKVPLKNEQGEVVGIMGVFSDASQRKLFDEVLQRYELLLKHTGDFIWIIDPHSGQILEANQAACAAYGYTRQEITKLSIHDFRVNDQRLIDSQLAEAREKGVLLETMHRRKDGSFFPVQINSAGACIGDRDVLISIIRDMTETVKARDELKNQNAYLSMLHQTALSLINRLDSDELFEQIAERAASLAQQENAFIFALDADGRTFSVKAGTGVCAKYRGQKFPADAGLNAEIVATGKAVVVNEYKKWPLRLDDRRLDWLEAILGVPLLSAGKVIGIIGFIGVDETTKFTGQEPALVADLANLASLALGNARLYAAAQAEIGERRRAEEALRKTESLTRSIMDSVHIGMTMIGPDMRVMAANKYLRRLFADVDFDQSPRCYETFNQLPDSGRCSFCPAAKTFADGEVHEALYTTPAAGGERKVRLIASPIKDDRDKIVAVVEMSEDITARLLAEEEIRKLSQAVDQSPGIVVITDTDGRITYVNAKFTETTGYPLAEIRGQTPRLLKSGSQPDSFYKNLWETVKAGKEWRGELCNRKKSGELFWSLTSISPVKNLEGKVAYYLAIQQDITEQKAIAETLQRKNREIQNALTTLKQTQAQLIQQEKMAGIGQLAAGVAHEINNPLGFVLSNFETLQKYISRLAEMITAYRDVCRQVRREDSRELMVAAESIQELEKKYKLDYIMDDLPPIFAETGEGISRIENIVRALRLFSRVDETDRFAEYDLNAGLRSTLTVARNEIKYVADVEEELGDIPVIQAMGGKINQVLLNIVLNAGQAIRNGHSGPAGLIKIRSFADSEAVYCVIEDNGPGIPPEVLKSIFNPFFTTKPVGQGTGLGLSISYDIIVNKHGGEIIVDSKPGAGATFTVKLPVRQPGCEA